MDYTPISRFDSQEYSCCGTSASDGCNHLACYLSNNQIILAQIEFGYDRQLLTPDDHCTHQCKGVSVSRSAVTEVAIKNRHRKYPAAAFRMGCLTMTYFGCGRSQQLA